MTGGPSGGPPCECCEFCSDGAPGETGCCCAYVMPGDVLHEIDRCRWSSLTEDSLHASLHTWLPCRHARLAPSANDDSSVGRLESVKSLCVDGQGDGGTWGG